jgi:hypothetical protein
MSGRVNDRIANARLAKWLASFCDRITNAREFSFAPCIFRKWLELFFNPENRVDLYFQYTFFSAKSSAFVFFPVVTRGHA